MGDVCKISEEREREVVLFWPPVPTDEEERKRRQIGNLEAISSSNIFCSANPPIDPAACPKKRWPDLARSVNILSARVLESDVGFPVRLYGTIIVRDDLDRKCVYLFRRGRHDAQLINSPDESLTLTGPPRGLVVFDQLCFEFNLKIRVDHQIDVESPNNDKDFSKECTAYNAVTNSHIKRKDRLASWLSTMELSYACLGRAVEAAVHLTIHGDSHSAEVGPRHFFGKITAQTTDIAEDFVLYDNVSSGNMMTVGEDGAIELHRRVIAVPIAEELSLQIDAWDESGKTNHCRRVINFTPDICGEQVETVNCRFYEVKVKVVWSALFVPHFDYSQMKRGS